MRHVVRVLAGAALVGALVTGAAHAASSPPVSTSPPTVEGTPIVGKKLVAGNGLWRNAPSSFAYRWLRCDARGNGCAKVPGATSRAYVLGKADLGHTMIVLVTASNAAGSSPPTNSRPTDVVTPPAPPTDKTAPRITGKPFVGEELVADPGTYAGGAVAKVRFQWRRCDDAGTSCADIPGATGQTYGVLKADLEHTLRVDVTASNEYGSVTSESKATAVVRTAPEPPKPVTTTMSASRTATICCQTVVLSGTVSTQKAGERVTILALERDDVVADALDTLTGAGGAWSLRVRPRVETRYVAQTTTSKSAPLTVYVHPRLGLGVRGNTFSAKITARDTFAGTVALFQIRTAGGGWKTTHLVVTNLASVARFHVSLHRGKTYFVRIYLPQRQAGSGYLDGISHTRRVGGAT
jgi:hypothetical protein